VNRALPGWLGVGGVASLLGSLDELLPPDISWRSSWGCLAVGGRGAREVRYALIQSS
jgi:hypothetical protein